MQFSGSDYPVNRSVTIAFYDPTFRTWNPWLITTANASGDILVEAEIPDLKLSVGPGDCPETYGSVSFRTQIGETVYSYADYNQYSRGLKRVGNQIASGLYGNGTNFASTFKVKVGDSLPISGRWFHPNDVVYVKWDGVAVVGTVTGDEWSNLGYINSTIANSVGSFDMVVTIPSASVGEHYLAVEDSETRVIIKLLVSQGTLQISPSSGPGGVNVQFTGSEYPMSTSVTISYLDPAYGLWNYLGSTTSSPTGSISFTTEMPDLRKSVGIGDNYPDQYTAISFRTEVSGNVHCYADYNQYWRGLARVGNQIAIGLYGNGTRFNSTLSVDADDSFTISGRWFHPNDVIYVRWDGEAVVGTVTGDEWLDAEIIGTAIASSTGSFETTVVVPRADVGEHYVSVEDSETRVIVTVFLASSPPAPTPTPTPTPEPTPTPAPTPSPPPKQPGSTVTVSCRSTTQYPGFDAEIYGTVSFNGIYASGESVLISYSANEGESWTDLTSAKTDSDGKFQVFWKPLVTGNCLVKAKWPGNSTFNEASTIVNFAFTPYSEETWFSLTSTSTITDFAFNSTTKILSFTASGPSDTTGHVSVYIPKTLVDDISSLNVYVDETEVTYSSESEGDSWVLSFSYTHSEHKIVIELSAASKADETPTDTLIYVGVTAGIAVAIAVAVATIVFKRKRQHNTEPAT